MRKYIDIIAESQAGPSSSEIEYFAEENCASFAYALWIAHGKPQDGSVEILSDPNGEAWSDEFEEEITHVVYSTGDNILIDIRGIQTVNEIKNHYHGDFVSSFDPQSFWDWAVGDDDKPLYGDQETIEEALNIIHRYPHIYGLSEPISESDLESEEWHADLARIASEAKVKQVSLDVEPGNDSILLISIDRVGAKKGVAAEVIWDLCRLADQNDLTIHLHVEGGMRGLVRYYERFGFELDDYEEHVTDPHPDADEHSYGEEVAMVREPRIISNTVTEGFSGMIAPDIGSIIEVDDPHQSSDQTNYNGPPKGKRHYRVTGWYKEYEIGPDFDLDTDEGFDAYFEYMLARGKDPVFDEQQGILAQNARKVGPDDKRLVACTREEAEYVSGAGVSGTIQRVQDCKVIGRVKWSEEEIAKERTRALNRIGYVIK